MRREEKIEEGETNDDDDDDAGDHLPKFSQRREALSRSLVSSGTATSKSSIMIDKSQPASERWEFS